MKNNSRRDFIKAGSLAGLTTIALGACNTVPAAKKEEQTDENFTDSFELNEATIDILQQKIKTRQNWQPHRH